MPEPVFSSWPSTRRLVTLSLVWASVWLVGCASALPEQRLPDTEVPPQWSVTLPGRTEPTASAVQANWWNAFNDPTLTRWVEQALKANTTVRSAQAALLQARALQDVAHAGLGPNVGVSAAAQRSQVGDAAAGNAFKAGFDARWEPDVFGRVGRAAAAAQADAQAAAANLGQVRVSLAAEVAVNYIDLCGLQARLAIARSNLSTQLETLQITGWRVQAGLASSLDLEQARTASEQTRAQIPALETSVAQAFNALAVLTGQPPGSLQRELTAGAVPQPPARLAWSFPADTMRQRPDVRTAQHRVQAAWARVAQADAARFPSFALTGSLGLNAARLADVFDPTAFTRSLLASVTGSLFDGGAAQAQLQAQTAALEQTRVAYEAAVLGALQEVENALATLRGDGERLQRLQAAAEAAANAELLARQRYASGVIDFRTVLDTQRTLLSTQSDLAAMRATYSADHVRLYKALGGGWTPTETQQP
jgi:outer membrane protein, multidrug efflux system